MPKPNYLGEYGFKIEPVFTTKSSLAEIPTPTHWENYLVDYIQPDSGNKTKESNPTESLNRVITAWRWWADSYGYFHRKTDSLHFGAELSYLLKTETVIIPSEFWTGMGLRQVYGMRGDPAPGQVYIDPETQQIVETRDAYTHPILISNETKYNINTSLISGMTDAELAHLGRVLAIATDVAIHISGFATSALAETYASTRPVQIEFIGLEKLSASALKILSSCIVTSSELADLVGKSRAQVKFLPQSIFQTQVLQAKTLHQLKQIRNQLIWTPTEVLSEIQTIKETNREVSQQAVALKAELEEQPEKAVQTSIRKEKVALSTPLNSLTAVIKLETGEEFFLTFYPRLKKLLLALPNTHTGMARETGLTMFVQTIEIAFQQNWPLDLLKSLTEIGDNETVIQLQKLILQQLEHPDWQAAQALVSE